MVVGEGAEGEAGEEAEGAVEGADDWGGDEAAVEAGRDGELRDEPLGLGGCDGAEGCGEGLDFGGGEAVEEEVGDDEVVGRVGGVEGAGVGVVECGCGRRAGRRGGEVRGAWRGWRRRRRCGCQDWCGAGGR